MSDDDRRLSLFCSPIAPEIFHSIEHTCDIWRPDPFDVRDIHLAARERFERLVEPAGDGTVGAGRILLIRGEAGAGKTHLMRAFRNYVHDRDLAFFGYMQMTTSSPRYDRYLLQNLMSSLDQPYAPEEATSLQRLSDAVVDRLPAASTEALQETTDGPTATAHVSRLADEVVDTLRLPSLDIDLIRGLLYLQTDRPSVRARVLKFLRSEALTEYDWGILGAIGRRNVDDAPLHHVAQLARLGAVLLNRALVLCVDQFEDIFQLDDASERFQRAMSAVMSVADQIPSAVVVVSCLENFYEEMRGHLTRAAIDRLELDPPPVDLDARRSEAEARAMVGRRLDYLWDTDELPPGDADPTHPLPAAFITGLVDRKAREILNRCLQYRDRAIQLGGLPPVPNGGGGNGTPPEALALMQQWSDFVEEPRDVPDGEAASAALLRDSIIACGAELGRPELFRTAAPDGNAVVVDHALEGDPPRGLYVAVCESRPQGGGLQRQLETAVAAAGDRRLVAVRSAPFSKSPKTRVARYLGDRITSDGARRAEISDTDWRRMAAFVDFRAGHGDASGFDEFVRTEQPLGKLSSLQRILALDDLRGRLTSPPAPIVDTTGVRRASGLTASSSGAMPATEDPSPGAIPGPGGRESAPDDPPAPAPPAPPTTLLLGHTRSKTARPVTIEVERLKRHMTFMGGTGTGKTTAALTVVESLLLRGVPAILVDRKGDLCGYGMSAVWHTDVGNAELDAARRRLRERIDVALYTPGNPGGRGLAIPMVPRGTAAMPAHERTHDARIAAGALCDMMRYGQSQSHQGRRAALQKAIAHLGGLDDEVTIAGVLDLLHTKDAEFMYELGNLAQFTGKLALDLEIFRARNEMLLGLGSEPLDPAALLGHGRADGKTRLTIISTKFLGPEPDVQFWVAHLLMALNRWLDRHPSDTLQAVVLLDEADIYLPATRQPASKGPVEDLLKRGRSKGLGLFLATQNPGDFDYKCRDNITTWLVGRLTQDTALAKLKALFSETNADPGDLAGQDRGQFHLLSEGRVTRIETVRNCVALPSQVADADIVAMAAAGHPSG